MPLHRHPAAIANDEHEQHDGYGETSGDGDDGRLGPKLAAGKKSVTGERDREDPLADGAAGDRYPEDATFGEIPTKMQADRKPQISRQGVSGTQEHARLESDGRGGDDRGARVQGVQ